MSSNDMDIETSDAEINLLISILKRKAHVVIVEQPAPRSHRFRYSSEGEWASSIRGINYTPLDKRYPKIKVMEYDEQRGYIAYRGKARVEVSCVFVDPHETSASQSEVYKQHPYKLVGKEGCEYGICKLPFSEETMSIMFSHLGIHRVKKDEIEESLALRESMKIDPYKAGFSHRGHKISAENLKTLRLCFQVYVKENGIETALEPIVSNPIINQTTAGKPIIVKLSHCVCPATGSKHDIMIFCGKVEQDNIEIRFFEKSETLNAWEAFGMFVQVHKDYGISFRAPSYKDINIMKEVQVFIQLSRPSDNAVSEEIPFEYHPISSNPIPRVMGIKRLKLLNVLRKYDENSNLPSSSKKQFLDIKPNISQNSPVPNNPFEGTSGLTPIFQNLDLPSSSNVQMNRSLQPTFDPNIPSLVQTFRPRDPATPRSHQNFQNSNFSSTTNVEVNASLNSSFDPNNLSLVHTSHSPNNNILETSRDPLPNFDQLFNIKHLHLDTDMEEESKTLNQNVLVPNLPFNNLPMNNNCIINNGTMQDYNLIDSLLGENFDFLT